MAVASRKQRAITDIPESDVRWVRFGHALQAWREDVLGYKHRTDFARKRGIDIRLVQDLENNYRQSYTKWAFDDATAAYEIQPAAKLGEIAPSMLAVLYGEAGTFVRADGTADAPPVRPAPAAAPGLPPPPQSELIRDDAVRPYADPIWEKLLELRDQGIADPSGAQLGLSSFYAKVWDDARGTMVLSDRVWLVGTVLRNAAAQYEDRQQGASGA